MMSRIGEIGGRLYRGEVSINFVGRRRMWYAISGCFVVISVIALLVRGLNFSVDFKGGALFQFNSRTATSAQISRAASSAGVSQPTIQELGVNHLWQVQTQTLTNSQATHVETVLAHALNIPASAISPQVVGATWGSQVTEKALEGLIIFIVVIVIYLSIAFEWKMAVAAFVALLHDILITVGVYVLAGFQVSPTTVVGFLTILGYALYDTVVVFDKVRENTAGLLTSRRSSYSEAANLALNQTLVRSINTSLTALLPVASILFIGAGVLGAYTLKDLALVLLVGMLSGAYASICIATPVLADLKEREPRYKDLAARVERRLAGGRAAQRAAARAEAGATRVGVTRTGVTRAGAVSAAIDDTEADDADDLVTDEVTGLPSATVEEEPVADDEVTVSAGPGPGGTPAPRRVVRQQQPRRGGSAQRRPGAKKKRR
jgi:preprotein translocase subunit SecF